MLKFFPESIFVTADESTNGSKEIFFTESHHNFAKQLII